MAYLFFRPSELHLLVESTVYYLGNFPVYLRFAGWHPGFSQSRKTYPLVEPVPDFVCDYCDLLRRSVCIGNLGIVEKADNLFVGLGTIKTHIHHIYGKLEVRNRVQAIARAREIGLF